MIQNTLRITLLLGLLAFAATHAHAAQFVPATKNTAGINAALAALEASTDGGEVFLPAGVYTINSPIKFPASKSRSFKMRGEGQNVTLLKVSGSIGLDLIMTDPKHTATIGDLTFYTDTVYTATGIKITYPTSPSLDRHKNPWATLERVHVRPGSSGGYFKTGIDLNRAWNTKIRDCQITGADLPNRNYKGDGILFSSSSVGTVIENTQINFWDTGVRLAPTTGVTHQGYWIMHCSIVGVNTGIEFVPYNYDDDHALWALTIQNCHIDAQSTPGGAAYGIFMENARECNIRGNLIYAGYNPGFKVCIWIQGEMVQITSNQLRPWWYDGSSSGNGVVVGNSATVPSRAITMTDNIVWQLQNGTGFWIQQGSTDCRVIGNTFNDCISYTKVTNQGGSTNLIAYN